MFYFFKSPCLTDSAKEATSAMMVDCVPALKQSKAVIRTYNTDFWRTRSLLPTPTPAVCDRIPGYCPHSCLPWDWELGEDRWCAKC